MTEIRLLTEAEVAVILRCSPRNVRRLRMEGLLGFLPGRPPKFEMEDLRAYVDATKIKKTPHLPATREDTQAEIEAREWARKEFNRRRERKRELGRR